MNYQGKRIKHKWGFGMSPISSTMEERYTIAIEEMEKIVTYNKAVNQDCLKSISEFKGMINRCIKQDQWDWFSVWIKMGNPPVGLLREILKSIIVLRDKIKTQEYEEVRNALERLKFLGIEKIFKNFLENDDNKEGAGWVYILSTRENPSLLKIGMTSRDLVKRVNEINSATGVVFPFSVRGAFRVTNPQKAEKSVFEALSEFRVREDREFFEIDFYKAKNIVRERLKLEKFLINDWASGLSES